MRMKFNKSSQLLLVSAASLLVASLLTACSRFTETLTVDLVYVASSKAAGPNNYGEIDVFEIDSESGRMRQIPASPFPSEGRNPVAEAVSSDNANLFVVNQDDNNIVQFSIGSDGKLYPYNTVNTPGVFPLAIAANATNLFVLDTYQPLPSCSPAAPCSGSIAVFPLTAGSSTQRVAMGTPAVNPSIASNFWPLTLTANPKDVVVPTAVNVLASGSYVYVSAYDASVTPHVGYIFGFSVATGGVLTPLAGSPFTAGVLPSSITSYIDKVGAQFVYIPDYTKGNVLGYSVAAATGLLTPLAGNPFPAGNSPSGIIVDPSFPFAYVANSTDSTVTAYSVSSGALTRLGSYATGLDPVAISIDPSTNHFLYTANFLGNNVTNFELSQTAGTLLYAAFSPFVSNDQPTAVAAIPHNGTGAGIH
jgi:6-phosphogluconolactonase (cycloisomerase 2 family)